MKEPFKDDPEEIPDNPPLEDPSLPDAYEPNPKQNPEPEPVKKPEPIKEPEHKEKW